MLCNCGNNVEIEFSQRADITSASLKGVNSKTDYGSLVGHMSGIVTTVRILVLEKSTIQVAKQEQSA